jgi:hypothetical protein
MEDKIPKFENAEGLSTKLFRHLQNKEFSFTCRLAKCAWGN